MNKAQFRWLLAGYILVVVLTKLSDVWTTSVVPDVVKQLEPSLPTQPILLVLLLFALVLGVLGAGLVGFIGMFCFWPLARYIYLVGVLLKVFTYPLFDQWVVVTGWVSMFVGLELFLDGVILTLCLVGPAKELFIKKDESN